MPTIHPLLDASAPAVASTPVNAWCFCGHHACFHKNASLDDVQSMQDVQYTASRAMRPPSRGGSVEQRSRRSSDLLQGRTAGLDAPEARPRLASALGLNLGSEWGSQFQGSAASEELPSTRSMSLTDKPAKSLMRVDSQSVPAPVPRPVPMTLDIPDANVHAAQAEDLEQSATEVATSYAGTPALRGADNALDVINANVDNLRRDLAQFASPRESSPGNRLESTVAPAPDDNEISESMAVSMQQRLVREMDEEQQGTRQKGQQTSTTTWDSHGITRIISEIVTLRRALSQMPNVATSVHGLSQRVTALENFSFSHYGPIEDLHESLEHFDGRLLEIEAKVEELERFRIGQDSASVSRSEVSEEPRTSSQSHTREDAIERLRNIEAKLTDLEVLQGPSPEQPLDLEVVLLPWGRDMRGLWMDIDESSGQPASSQNSQSRIKRELIAGASEISSLPVGFDEWSRFKDDWKAPKACGTSTGSGGRAYERLQSRGFVRRITFTDKSAHHVHSAICAGFGDLLTLADRFASQSEGQQKAIPDHSLHGLKSAFLPLRKIHKSSRLRYLLEAELTTPMLWTASFLNDSVFMKAPGAGLTRLYITTPAGYLQPDGVTGWKWQKIRELPRATSQIPSDSSARASLNVDNGVKEADAREPCWEYDARLDPQASAGASSFGSSDGQAKQLASGSFASSHPLSPQPTEVDDAGSSGAESSRPFSEESQLGTSDGLHPAPITPITDRPASGLSLNGRRANSLPPSETLAQSRTASQQHVQLQSTPTKRAALSFDTGLRIGGHGAFDAAAKDDEDEVIQKRRRVSRSLATGHSTSSRSIDVTTGKKSPRDPAQHAYATPYSYGGAVPARSPRVAPDGDTEMTSEDESLYDPMFGQNDDDSDSDEELDDALTRDEETWEGVGDGQASQAEDTELDESGSDVDEDDDGGVSDADFGDDDGDDDYSDEDL